MNNIPGNEKSQRCWGCLRMFEVGHLGLPSGATPNFCLPLAAHMRKPALSSKRLNLVDLEVDEFSVAEEGWLHNTSEPETKFPMALVSKSPSCNRTNFPNEIPGLAQKRKSCSVRVVTIVHLRDKVPFDPNNVITSQVYWQSQTNSCAFVRNCRHPWASDRIKAPGTRVLSLRLTEELGDMFLLLLF